MSYKNGDKLLCINDNWAGADKFIIGEIVNLITRIKHQQENYCLESKRHINGHDGTNLIPSHMMDNYGYRWNMSVYDINYNFVKIKTNERCDIKC